MLSFPLIDRNPAAPAPDPRLPPQSCLLLPPTPVRGGQKAVVSKKTNMHIFIESGLRVRINLEVRLAAHSKSVPLNPLLNFQCCSFPLEMLYPSKLWNFFKGHLSIYYLSSDTTFGDLTVSEGILLIFTLLSLLL